MNVEQMPTREHNELVSWLESDEAKSRPYRANRLKWLLETFGSSEAEIMFFGGEDSHYIYLELRLAFIHGLYLSTVILVLSCIEHELAGALYAGGSDDSARAPLEVLLKRARETNVINDYLFTRINGLRDIRNAYAHFRPPTHATSSIRRALKGDVDRHELSQNEATQALQVLSTFIAR